MPDRDLVPLLVAMLRAKRDERVEDVLGVRCAVASLFEKDAMDPWYDRMYSRAEREEDKRRRERQREMMEQEMMVAKLRAMARRFAVKEV